MASHGLAKGREIHEFLARPGLCLAPVVGGQQQMLTGIAGHRLPAKLEDYPPHHLHASLLRQCHKPRSRTLDSNVAYFYDVSIREYASNACVWVCFEVRYMRPHRDTLLPHAGKCP